LSPNTTSSSASSIFGLTELLSPAINNPIPNYEQDPWPLYQGI